MPASKQKPFPELLEKFKTRTKFRNKVKNPRLILIIMANTHDPELNKACAKDARAVKKAFADICKHVHYQFITIEISGDHYNGDNMYSAITSIELPSEKDVIIFYYTGHGFSYKKENTKRKYPQVDMRPHSNQVDFNKINFIEEHTENLAVILSIMRLKGGRINIVIGDCCNTTIPFERPKVSEKDMNIVQGLLPQRSKKLTPKMMANEQNEVCILVASSQHGQPAVTDAKIGSIFTHHFASALASSITKLPKGTKYLPWLKLLKQTADKAFKDSKGYDIGGGKAGKQKAVFEVFTEKE